MARIYRLDEIDKKLHFQDFDIHDKDTRSPSPEYIYDAKTGLRTNTRENRARNRLTEERIEIIEELLETHPEFGAPNDYKPPKKTQKIFLPDNALDPDMNYVGMILGPKGKTQKELERKTGCKISIRGRGSQKSKKN